MLLADLRAPGRSALVLFVCSVAGRALRMCACETHSLVRDRLPVCVHVCGRAGLVGVCASLQVGVRGSACGSSLPWRSHRFPAAACCCSVARLALGAELEVPRLRRLRRPGMRGGTVAGPEVCGVGWPQAGCELGGSHMACSRHSQIGSALEHAHLQSKRSVRFLAVGQMRATRHSCESSRPRGLILGCALHQPRLRTGFVS